MYKMVFWKNCENQRFAEWMKYCSRIAKYFGPRKRSPRCWILNHVWAKQWNARLECSLKPSLKPSCITFHFVAASTFTLTELFSYTWQQPVCSPLKAGEICSQNLKSEKVMEPNLSIESAWKIWENQMITSLNVAIRISLWAANYMLEKQFVAVSEHF